MPYGVKWACLKSNQRHLIRKRASQPLTTPYCLDAQFPQHRQPPMNRILSQLNEQAPLFTNFVNLRPTHPETDALATRPPRLRYT